MLGNHAGTNFGGVLHIYRVMVKGRFGPLGDDLRARLVAAADDHDVFDAAFTEAGTFTFDRDLNFFTFRYQLRAEGDDAAECEAIVVQQARTAAVAHLAAHGIGHGELTVRASDMASVWKR